MVVYLQLSLNIKNLYSKSCRPETLALYLEMSNGAGYFDFSTKRTSLLPPMLGTGLKKIVGAVGQS